MNERPSKQEFNPLILHLTITAAVVMLLTKGTTVCSFKLLNFESPGCTTREHDYC